MAAPGARAGSRLHPAVPAGLLGAVLVCDLLRDHRVRSRALTGVLDEVAHLATTALGLLATRDLPWLRARRTEVGVALAASVLVDLDHLRLPAVSASVLRGGRSVTHSMTTVTGVLLGALAAPPAHRSNWIAAAAGLAAHFGRDAATGPGLRLWWPVRDGPVRVHYGAYALVSVVTTAVATARLRRRR